jgi:hypothetical protein
MVLHNLERFGREINHTLIVSLNIILTRLVVVQTLLTSLVVQILLTSLVVQTLLMTVRS